MNTKYDGGYGIEHIMVSLMFATACIAAYAERIYSNRNINQNYIQPRNAIIRAVDRDFDGSKETVLEITGKDGKKKTIDLTLKNLEKLLQQQK